MFVQLLARVFRRPNERLFWIPRLNWNGFHVERCRVTSLLKLFHNFCLLQVLTKEVISANRGEVPQNSLAEHIMQKFIEVFHCWCLLLAIFKLFHFIVLSVVVSDVLFSRALHRLLTLFIGGMFSRAYYRLQIFCAFGWHFFPRFSPAIMDIFSRAFQRLRLLFAVCFPALSISYVYFLKFWLLSLLLQFSTVIVILFTGIRFQRQSKVARWDVQQDGSFLFSS